MPELDRPYRALIVEDDPGIRRLIEKVLQRNGIQVDIAHDGKVAMDKISAGRYNVIVLDLMLPGANGYEIIEFIKRNGAGTPVAVVSAVSQQGLTRLDLDVVKLVIPKPFDVYELSQAILGLCRNPIESGSV
jgi:DNA-binding response OmpR family regulator